MSLPPVGPAPLVKERVGRSTLFSSSAMSSGQLFLDRVGCHQSPSPLRRPDQIKLIARSEGTIYHRTERLHFTPTDSSWLNQVELWFAKIDRGVIARGVFTSVGDLRRKLMHYIRAYAKRARPIRWTYTHLKRRIVNKRITGTIH